MSKKLSVKQRSKVQKKFYISLIKAFMVTNILCFSGLGYISYRLIKYEENTPEGSIRSYLKLVEKEKYEEIYKESKLVFAQFNKKEDYISYLKEYYNNKDLANAKFIKQSYSNEEFLYYNINNEDNELISTVQLKEIDNKYHVRTLTSIWNFDFDVVDNIQFSINDLIVDDGYITEKDTVSNAFANMNNTKDVAKVTRYHLDNFVNIPTIEVLDDSNIAVKDVIKDQFYIGYVPENKKEYEEILLKMAQTYSKYITEDEKFYNLRKLLLKTTKFYQDISTFNNGWFSVHDSIEFRDIEIYDIVLLDENSFIGTVKYDYDVIAKNKIQTYPIVYQMMFIKEKDTWLCTNLLLGN